MYVWEIVEVRDHPISMGRTEFETIPNMKMVGLMIQLTRALWITWKEVIMDSGFCVLKVISEMRKRLVYVSALIKRGDICLGGFMEMASTLTSGQNILVMWDVLVVNGIIQSLIFFF